MRRRPGLKGLGRANKHKERFKQKGKEIEDIKLSHITTQLTVFKENLEKFARKHKREINENPVFRRQFQDMCTKVGVDPLASHKGFWAELLGVGDFYYELAVQIVEICLSTRLQNGGLMLLEELLYRLQNLRRKHHQEISKDDIERAVAKVGILGNGFQLINVGNKRMVVSVPIELSKDHEVVLEKAEKNSGWITITLLQQQTDGWSIERAHKVLNLMMEEGMIWVDSKAPNNQIQYWFPSLILQQ